MFGKLKLTLFVFIMDLFSYLWLTYLALFTICNGHIFYGNEMLILQFFGITDLYKQYNGRESFRLYSWRTNSNEPAGFYFSSPSTYSYTLNISVQIPSLDVDNDGYCKITFNSSNYDLYITPDHVDCQNDIGILKYDDWSSGCNQLINKNGYIDNLIITNHESDNSSFIYIDGNLIHEIGYNIESSFGFLCDKAEAFISDFTFIIDNGNTENMFSIDPFTLSPTSTPSFDLNQPGVGQDGVHDNKNIHPPPPLDIIHIIIIIGGVIAFIGICIVIYFKLRNKRNQQTIYGNHVRNISIDTSSPDHLSVKRIKSRPSVDV